MHRKNDWISPGAAARILEVSRSTVSRSVATDEQADRAWGPDNWRCKPLALKRFVMLRRSAVEAKLAESLRADIEDGE